MTQQILFIIVILIGAFYAYQNGKKAKSDIERFQQNKAEDNSQTKQNYLDNHVFFGLKNRNTGFDADAITYFSEDDFQTVLQRVESSNLGICSIKPWSDGEFSNAANFEDFGNDPFNPDWYTKAFEDFKKEKKNLLYAATYEVPESLL
ncbi:hypothetical protein [Flavobacterium pedocola]